MLTREEISSPAHTRPQQKQLLAAFCYFEPYTTCACGLLRFTYLRSLSRQYNEASVTFPELLGSSFFITVARCTKFEA
jgi:hypothetical protein